MERNETAARYNVLLTLTENRSAIVGPFSHLMLAEQTMAAAAGRPDLMGATIDVETAVRDLPAAA